MSRLTEVLLLICLHVGFTYAAMDCSILGQKNFLDRALNSNHCPGYLDSPEKSYCCITEDQSKIYCCDVEEFAVKTSLNILTPVVIAASIVSGLIVCCICCFCCRCCPWHRRRHQGTVYGIQAPVAQVIPPQTNFPPSYTSQPTQNVPYPINSTGMPQPSPYSSEAYAKQAPYNPAYPSYQ